MAKVTTNVRSWAVPCRCGSCDLCHADDQDTDAHAQTELPATPQPMRQAGTVEERRRAIEEAQAAVFDALPVY